VKVCAPVSSADHPPARALLKATRAAMLAHLDEPDLAPDTPAESATRATTEAAPEEPREENHIPA
jgi:hypothetical protein